MKSKEVNTGSNPVYLSVSDVAKKLGISIDTARRWDKQGVLTAERTNGLHRTFKASDIDAFMATQPMTTSQVAKDLGVSLSTVRRLDAQGLLFTERTASGKRLYSRESISSYKQAKQSGELTATKPREALDQSTHTDVVNPTLPFPEVEPAFTELPHVVMASEVMHQPTLKAVVAHHRAKVQARANARQQARQGSQASQSNIAQVVPVRRLTAGQSLDNALRFYRRTPMWLRLVFVSALTLLIVMTLLFLLFPSQMDRTFGYDNTGKRSNKQSGLLSWLLSPSAALAHTASTVVRSNSTNTSITNAVTTNSSGALVPKDGLALQDSSDLKVPDQGLVANLNAQFVQGRQPGTSEGNLAVLPLNGSEIIDRTITGTKLADGTITINNLSSAVINSLKGRDGAQGPQGAQGFQGSQGIQGPQGATGPAGPAGTGSSSGSGTITDVNAGTGLTGGGSSGTVTLSVVTGNSIMTQSNALEVRLAPNGTTSTTSSASGLEVTSSGLRLVGGCSNGQILKWNGTVWACSNETTSSSGSVAVQTSDGNSYISTVNDIQFGPVSGSNTEFNVANLTGGAVRIQLGSGVLQSSNYSATLDPIYVNENETPAAGDITGSFTSGLKIGTGAVNLATNTNGNFVSTVAAGNGVSISGSGAHNAAVTVGLQLATSGTTSTTSSPSGLEVTSSGLSLISGCTGGQILKYSGSSWACGADNSGSSLAVLSNGTTVTPAASALNYSSDFSVGNVSTQANIGIDYAASGITRRNGTETIAGNWSFNDASFTLQDNADSTKQANFELGGLSAGVTRTISLPDASGMMITTGNLNNITSVGTLTAGVWNGSTVGVAYGGTGSTSFTSNGLIYGNGSGSLQVTAAGTAGQVLLANASGVPQFVSFSGDVTIAGTGAVTIANNAITTNKITDGSVTNTKLANSAVSITVGAGLNGGGSVSLGGSLPTALNVAYGSTSGTAVQGNTSITCASGAGNLSGGGSVITLGSGGTCGSISISNAPTFTTSVTSPLFTGAGTTVSSTGAGNDLTLASGRNIVLSGFNCTTYSNGGVLTTDASGNLRCDHGSPVNTITGSGTTNRIPYYNGSGTLGDSWLLQNNANLQLDNGKNLELSGGNLIFGGTTVISSARALQNVTADGSIINDGTLANSKLANSSLSVTAGTGLSGGGSVSLGSSTSLSVNYGSSANTAAQGNTSLSFTGSGNLTGGVTATAGGGVSANTLALVNNPSFSGQVTAGGINNSGATQFELLTLGNYPSGGPIGSAATTVDITTAIQIAQTTAGQTLSLPLPSSTTAGRELFITNSGSVSFIMAGQTVNVGAIANFMWNGAAWATTSSTIAGTGLSQNGNVISSTAATSVVNDTNIQGSISGNALTLSFNGQLSVGRGGTGASSFTSNGLIYGNGTGSLQATTAGTSGQLVVAGAGGVPSFVSLGGDASLASDGTLSLASTAVSAGTYGDNTHVGQFTVDSKGRLTSASSVIITGAAPTGSASGDLSGNFPSPTIAKFQGTNLTISSLSSGQVLQYNGSAWVNQSITGDVTLSSTGAATIGNGTVTGTKIASNTITNGNLLSGSYGNITTVGTLTSLAVAGGAFNVNSSGAITSATGIASSGTITLSGLGAGVVHAGSGGTLTSSAVLLGTDTTGNYVASLGSLTGLTAGGTTGVGAVPSLSVNYGSSANTAAQGNTSLSFTGSGNLTGGVTATAGGGVSANTLALVNNPSFSGQVTAGGVNNTGSSLYSIVNLGNYASGGSIGSAASTVDITTSLSIAQTTAGQTLSLPLPTSTAAGRLLFVSNSGTASFNLSGQTITAGSNATFIWNGSNWALSNTPIAGTGLSQNGNVINSTASTSVVNDTNIQGSISGNALTLSFNGQLSVGRGGTGASSFTSNGILYGNGSGALQATAAGTSGQLLVANVSGVPTFVGVGGDASLAADGTLTLASTAVGAGTYGDSTHVGQFTVDSKGRLTSASSVMITGAAPTGSAGGDLGGNFPNPTIAKLQGKTLTIGNTPGTGDLLLYNGSAFVNQTVSGDVSINGSGVMALGNGVVTNSKLANSSLSVTAGTGLSGGGSVSLGSSTSLSVNYGSSANTAAQGNTSLSFTGSGNLTGGVTATAGGGVSANTLALVSNPSFSGTITASANGSAIAVTGTPTNTATAAQLLFGNSASFTGNSALNGGTFIGVNAPASGAGSAADFLNFQANGTSKVKIDVTGAIMAASFNGIGSALTSLNGTNVSSGTVGNSFLTGSGALNVSAGTGLSGGGSVALGGSTTLNLANTTVTAASYGSAFSVATFTVDQQGRLTAAGSTPIAIATSAITSGNYVATLGTVTGLTVGSNSGTASAPTLSVNYGSSSTSAVRGDTTLTCASGTGNLTGGGTAITLGSGGTCGAITTNAAVSFGTSVTTPLVTNAGALTVSTTGANDLTLTSGSGNIILGGSTVKTTTSLTYDLNAAATTTYSITNSNASNVANLSVEGSVTAVGINGGNGQIQGTGGLNISGGATLGGTVTLSSLATAGVLHTDASGLLTTSAVVLGTDTSGAYVQSTSAGTGISLGGTASIPTINLANTTVTAASYGSASSVATFTVDAQGRLTAAGSTPIAIATSAIISGNYVATLGSVTGLTVGSNSGTASAPTLSVNYGSSANTSAQGNTSTGFSGNGNLTGSITATAGGGVSANTLDVKSNPTFTGLVTGQNSTTGLALTGAPTAGTGITSLIQVGAAIAGGNSVANGGTYYGLNAPNTGAGSAADFLNFQYNGTSKLLVTNTGAVIATSFSGNGSALTSLNGTNVSSGTVGNSFLTGSGALNVSAGTGLSGGGSVALGGSTTLNLANTTVTAASYGSASSVATFTVDQQGRLTAAGSTPIAIATSAITSGNYVATLGTVTGLTVGSNSGTASAPTLSVNYGSSSTSAVRGDTTLTCPSGSGNLSGGGTVITLGSGGSCAGLTIISNPTFSGLTSLSGGATINGINTTAGANTVIGNGTGSFSLASSALNITTGGIITGAGSINGLTITSGALSGVTGITTSGGYTQTGTSANSFSGATNIQTTTNTAGAFNVANNAGASIFSVDTSANNVNNLLTNPSIESSISGNWLSKGGAVVAQSSTNAYLGSNSLSIVPSGVNSGTKQNVALANSTTYTLTMYARLDTTNVPMNTFQIGYSQDGTTDTSCQTGLSLNRFGWTRVTCSFTTGTVSGTTYIYAQQTDAANRTMYIDGAMLESSTNPSAVYHEGTVSLNASVNSPLIVQPTSNSTNAFEVNSARGAPILTVDTTDSNMLAGSNAGLESGPGTWAGYGAGAITQRSSDYAYTGNYSLKVSTTATANTGAKVVYSVGSNLPLIPAGTNYTFSWYERASGSSFTTINVAYSADGTIGNEITCTPVSTFSAATGGWTRNSCNFNSGAVSPTTSAYLTIRQSDATARSFYLDGMQLEQGSTASAYGGGNLVLNATITAPITARNVNDSTTAFQIQNSSNTNLFVADTLNNSINLGVKEVNTTTGNTALAVTGAPQAIATSSLVQLGAAAITGGSANGTYLGLNTSGATTADLLNFQNNGTQELRVTSAGVATIAGGLTVSAGGIAVTGNSTITGTLGGLTGLTVASGGASISGGLSLNTSAITGATTIAANNTLTLSGTGANQLAVTGAPQAIATSSLVQLGAAAITGGSANGTYLGLNTSGATTADLLNFQNNGTQELRVTSAGVATIAGGLTVSAGGIAVTGNSTITGTLGGLTGLTVASGGASISGGLSLNTSAITGATTIAANNTLTLSGTGANQLAVTGAPQAIATSSLVQLGAAAITGGSANGTYLGLNTSGATTADLVNLQNNGVSKFKIDSSGIVSDQGTAGYNASSACTTVANVTVKGGILTSVTCSVSDQRFKTNITPVQDALAGVNQLQAVTYNYNDLYHQVTGDPNDSGLHYGLIAQQVQQIFPGLVKPVYGQYNSVDYLGLTAVLAQAIKQVDTKATDLGRFISSSNNGLSIDLSANKNLDIKDDQGNTQISFDSIGDGTFAGKLTAASFVVNGVDIGAEVDGLKSDVTDLQKRVTALEQSSSTGTGLKDANGQPVNFNNLVVGNQTVNLDLIVNGAITVNGNATFAQATRFIGDATFDGNITANGSLTLTNNSAGYAIIHATQTKVHVSFSKPYATSPIITVSLGNGQFAAYSYTNVTTTGFDIVLPTSATQDYSFSWTATVVTNPFVTDQAVSVTP